jgi:hypothetical protein
LEFARETLHDLMPFENGKIGIEAIQKAVASISPYSASISCRSGADFISKRPTQQRSAARSLYTSVAN